MSNHEKINYIEFQVQDVEATKAFFSQVFGWSYTDYGEAYVAFHGAGLDGGFYKGEQCSSTQNGAALLVFYSEAIDETLAKVEGACGTIIKPIFSFPGGHRFHFTDPSGNEFAVWSDLDGL